MRKIRSLFLTLVICGSTLSQGMSVSAQTTFPDGGKVDDDISRSSLLGVSNQFHIFANTASLTAHTSGNIAVGNLINTTSNFGTSIHEGTLAKDISYIQKLESIASSSFTTSNNKRTNKVVFGESVALTLVDNGNRVAANGITLDHLKKDEVFQDKHGKTYIDFAEEFKKLELSSNTMAGNPLTPGVEKNFIDENNRYFDISKAQSNPSGSVTLHKTDDAGKPLDGVTFDLYKEGQSDPIKKGLKTVHGKIKVDGLEKGNYFFKETASLDGYELNREERKFSIKDEHLSSGSFIYLSLTKDEIEKDRPILIKGINKNGPSIIVNVDTQHAHQIEIGVQTKLQYIDGTERNSKETENFSDARVLWNFTNRAAGQVININKAAPFLGSILAVGDTVNIGQNVDGSIIADTVNVKTGETHRWDFQEGSGKSGKSIEVKVVNKKKKTTTVTPTTTESTTTSSTTSRPTTTETPTTTSTTSRPTTTESTTTSSTTSRPTTTESTTMTSTTSRPTTTESTTTSSTTSRPTTTESTTTSSTTSRPTTTESTTMTSTTSRPTTTESTTTSSTTSRPTTTESTTTSSMTSHPTTMEFTTTTSMTSHPTTTESMTTTSATSSPTTSESTTTSSTTSRPTTTESTTITSMTSHPTTTEFMTTTSMTSHPTTMVSTVTSSTVLPRVTTTVRKPNLPKTGSSTNPWIVVVGMSVFVLTGGFLYASRREKN